MDSRILAPVHVHLDYSLSVDTLNDYTLKHASWLNSTTINLLATGRYGLHHMNDLDGVYIYRWISHSDIDLFQSDRDIIHDIVGTMDPYEDIVLLFEESNCYMIYRI